MVPSGFPWDFLWILEPLQLEKHVTVTSLGASSLSRQVAPATWAEKVGFRGGRKVRGDGKVDQSSRDHMTTGVVVSVSNSFLCSP